MPEQPEIGVDTSLYEALDPFLENTWMPSWMEDYGEYFTAYDPTEEEAVKEISSLRESSLQDTIGQEVQAVQNIVGASNFSTSYQDALGTSSAIDTGTAKIETLRTQRDMTVSGLHKEWVDDFYDQVKNVASVGAFSEHQYNIPSSDGIDDYWAQQMTDDQIDQAEVFQQWMDMYASDLLDSSNFMFDIVGSEENPNMGLSQISAPDIMSQLGITVQDACIGAGGTYSANGNCYGITDDEFYSYIANTAYTANIDQAWDWIYDPDLPDESPEDLVDMGITPGGFDLGSSDARLKEDIYFIENKNGINIYEFNYTWDKDTRYRGAMAQELLQTSYKNAVHFDDDGYMLVDYAKLPVNMEKV